VHVLKVTPYVVSNAVVRVLSHAASPTLTPSSELDPAQEPRVGIRRESGIPPVAAQRSDLTLTVAEPPRGQDDSNESEIRWGHVYKRASVATPHPLK
jgi:hypothetical protein